MSIQPQMMQPMMVPVPMMPPNPYAPAGAPGMPPAMPISSAASNQVGVQNYMPINQKRQLSAQEEKDIQAGKQRWIPTLGNNYSTPIPQLLASPMKGAVIGAVYLGAIAGAITLMLSRSGSRNLGRFGIGAIIGGVLGGFGSYVHREQRNGDVVDLMQRLPEGSTKRDLLADPVYQADLNRRSQANNGGSTDAALLGLAAGGLAAGSLYSSSRSSSGRLGSRSSH